MKCGYKQLKSHARWHIEGQVSKRCWGLFRVTEERSTPTNPHPMAVGRASVQPGRTWRSTRAARPAPAERTLVKCKTLSSAKERRDGKVSAIRYTSDLLWRPIELSPILGVFWPFCLFGTFLQKRRLFGSAATRTLVCPPSAMVLEVFESARRPKCHAIASLRHVRRLESARTPKKAPPSARGAISKRVVCNARSAIFGVWV